MILVIASYFGVITRRRQDLFVQQTTLEGDYVPGPRDRVTKQRSFQHCGAYILVGEGNEGDQQERKEQRLNDKD